MLVLGIETSCDETAVCLIRGRKVLAESVLSSLKKHSKYGGVVPEIASRSHVEAMIPCLDQVLKQSKVSLSKIDLIAVTGGPGLMGALLVGQTCAKSLSIVLNKPIVYVDHLLAHAYSGQWQQVKPKFPFISLVVSGGHTLILYWKSLTQVKTLGTTTDDAVGEAFDKVATLLGLPYPGGPAIEKLAKKGDTKAYAFPRPRLREDNFDFSFSGLKTAVYYKVKGPKAKKRITLQDKQNLAACFQEAACDVLVQKTLRACKQYKVKDVVVGGGVSANQCLRKTFENNINAKGIRILFPEMSLCMDNAVMIAALGQAITQNNLKKFQTPTHKQKALTFSAYTNFSASTSG